MEVKKEMSYFYILSMGKCFPVVRKPIRPFFHELPLSEEANLTVCKLHCEKQSI